MKWSPKDIVKHETPFLIVFELVMFFDLYSKRGKQHSAQQ